MAIFTGAGVAIVTPFNEDGSINYDRLDLSVTPRTTLPVDGEENVENVG